MAAQPAIARSVRRGGRTYSAVLFLQSRSTEQYRLARGLGQVGIHRETRALSLSLSLGSREKRMRCALARTRVYIHIYGLTAFKVRWLVSFHFSRRVLCIYIYICTSHNRRERPSSVSLFFPQSPMTRSFLIAVCQRKNDKRDVRPALSSLQRYIADVPECICVYTASFLCISVTSKVREVRCCAPRIFRVYTLSPPRGFYAVFPVYIYDAAAGWALNNAEKGSLSRGVDRYILVSRYI